MAGDQIMLVAIVAILTFGSCVCAIALAFSARARAKLKGTTDLTGMESRLERIEQSLDSVAVEVERVSEAQRFTARILTEHRDVASVPLPAGEVRR